jgi:predicted amino acid-binding ACT domain protein
MRRLTIVGKYRKDLVADITGLLAHNGVDIRNINSHLAGQDAYITLTLSDFHRGFGLLMDAGYNAVSDDSVLLRVVDEPGSLARLSRKISEHGINTRAITMLHHDSGYTIAAISTDSNDKVRALFRDSLVS